MGTRDRVTLPPAARAAVEAEIGEIRPVEPVASGLNSAFAAVLHALDAAVFVKGMPSDHPRVRGQHREAAIVPHLTGIAPPLRWHLDVVGWDLLGFDYLPGRVADLSPCSHDLAAVACTLARLSELAPPDLPLRRIEQRWSGLADDTDLAQLAGDHLLHTDLNPNNILISDDRAWLVDWAWPTLGARGSTPPAPRSGSSPKATPPPPQKHGQAPSRPGARCRQMLWTPSSPSTPASGPRSPTTIRGRGSSKSATPPSGG
jgi:hypothetical protein